jgi:E3 ubiquitin-protein ligase BRE1
LEATRKLWAQAAGNEQAALASVDELVNKFNKRWSEFTESMTIEDSGKVSEGEAAFSSVLEQEQKAQAKQIAKLQHKLSQALENVRQAETTRQNLQEALTLNSSLLAKVEEVQAKYVALKESDSSESSSNRPAQGSDAVEPGGSSVPEEKETSSLTPREKDASPEIDPAELERKYKKAKQILADERAKRESLKSKWAQAEKERDDLTESNARLLKQISEKDEMNAKSLSTILQLKSMTEQLSAQKEALEQQAKSANQVALAARLATNAKERVAEEVVKEKAALEDRLKELEKRDVETKAEMARITAEFSAANGKVAAKDMELANALKRSEELVAENEEKREKIRKLVDSIDKAEREAREAKERLSSVEASAGSSSGGGGFSSSGVFTVDQLKTQVDVLKRRLACPVCHYRDKECIIMRCRHMHCKQCVEERISNRSRKCPSCNNKFSEKDVEDVWLS